MKPRQVSKQSHEIIDNTEIGRRDMLDYWQYEGLDVANGALAYEDEMNGDIGAEDSSEESSSEEED